MKQLSWALALAVALLPAGSLNAANITVTWTGTVFDGTDQSNTFGLGAGSNLAGQSFTATYVVDPTVGFIQTNANMFDTRGGTDVPGFLTSPLLSAELTINSQTYSFLSDKFGGYSRLGGAGVSDIYTEAAHQSGPAVSQLFLRVFLFDNSIPFTGSDEELDQALSSGTNSNFQAFLSDGSFLFSGHLTPTRVTISSAGDGDGDGDGDGSVPEPSTAVLLGTAVAALGILRRYRRA